MALNNLELYGDYSHITKQFARTARKDGSNNFYLAMLKTLPSTSTTINIYNVSTTDASATRVPAAGTSLSSVVSWRLSERDGNDFYYAFDSGMVTYATGFGWIAEYFDIPAIYVKRPTTTNINMQLVVVSIT